MDMVYKKLLRFTYALERNAVFASIKRGLLLLTPALIVGAVALMLRNLPVPAFHAWISQAVGGQFHMALGFVYDATIGIMSLGLLCGISYSYAETFAEADRTFCLVAVMAALGSFFVLFCVRADGGFDFSSLGAVSMFGAILCSIAATALFRAFNRYLPACFRSYSAGTDAQFQVSVSLIAPLAFCLMFFTLLSIGLKQLFGVENINEMLSAGVMALFANVPGELGKGVLFVLLTDLLWLFGIHGGNVMETVALAYFAPLDENPAAIVCKTFVDNFALIGGSGATLCLLFALLLCSRSSENRRLAWCSLPFGLFNMNEPLVFGLPVILNPILFPPFLAVPVVSLLIAYLATASGFMPVVTSSVTWTTPAPLSGLAASGSINGALVQSVILVAGTLIYIPFIRLAERMQQARTQIDLEDLRRVYWAESRAASGSRYNFLERPGNIGGVAKMVVEQLHRDIRGGMIPIHYQPQVDKSGRVCGAEALLRWKFHGTPLEPPLVITLAQEGGIFDQLTDRILDLAAAEAARFRDRLGRPFTVSVNISAREANDAPFIRRVAKRVDEAGLGGSFCLEVTEDTALEHYGGIAENLRYLSEHGVMAAIDDFSMGQTSLKYLQENSFQFVKLDGALVRQLLDSPRSQDIVRAIVGLGEDLHFKVVAEYVENEKLRDVLAELGCSLFQGYLYSPAVPADQLIEYVRLRDREKGMC